MSWIKILSINVMVTLSFIGFILVAPPIGYAVKTLFKASEPMDARGYLDIYSDYNWARHHFDELSSLNIHYIDYVTWRQKDFNGETITIENGLRKTFQPKSLDANAKDFWFFGGSTTWGIGVSDFFTYPSLFARLNNASVSNFGENGYIARQSLAYLINHLILQKKEDLSSVSVVFYDGFNDTVARCRTEVSGLSTDREAQIRDFLSDNFRLSGYSFSRTFDQLSDFLMAVSRKFSFGKSDVDTSYNCDSDIRRAYEVAETLVKTWETASKLIESKGGVFTAILHPNAYFGGSDFDYLQLTTPNDLAIARQIHTIYPLIIGIAERSGVNFINLSDAYNGCTDCYIDFAHVGPTAHQKLVNILSKHLID